MTTNRKLFLILLGASVLGTLAVLPYSFALQGGTPAPAQGALSLPLPALVALTALQSAVIFALAIAAGIWAAGRAGLGLPIARAALEREPIADRVRAILLPSLILGVLSGLAIIVLDVYVFRPVLESQVGAQAHALTRAGGRPAAWKGLLASFYGGINEEVLLRFGLLSVLAWLGGRILRTAPGQSAIGVLWSANIIAAILFGLGHLPATSQILPLSTLVVVRAIVLNGVGGVAFGYLYFTRGLESAMLAHFTADIVLHVLFVLVAG